MPLLDFESHNYTYMKRQAATCDIRKQESLREKTYRYRGEKVYSGSCSPFYFEE